MSDIVTRLRDRAYSGLPDRLLEEAADEIERLRGSTVEQRFCKPPVAGSTPAAGCLRDTFAAAALTGLIANGDYSVESTPLLAFRMADAMLRERARNGAPGWCETVQSDDIAETAAFCELRTDFQNTQRALLNLTSRIAGVADDICGVGSGVTVLSPRASDWLDAIAAEYHRVRIELEQLRAKANHDAAPAARACSESVAPQPTAHGSSVRTDKAEPLPACGTGDTPVPVTKPMPVFVSGSGSVTPASYEKSDEKRMDCDTTREPVAWATLFCGSPLVVSRFKQICDDEAHYQGDVATVIPLYRSPTLTGPERMLLGRLAGEADHPRARTNRALTADDRATLRGLLERMK